MVKVLGKKVSSKGNPKSRTSNGKVSLRQRSSFGQKQKQKQKQSVIININTNKIRNRSKQSSFGRVTPNIKPSYLQTITTYPIFREAPYEPLYRNSEPIREITAPFIDKTTPTMTTPAPSKAPAIREAPSTNESTSKRIIREVREKSMARQKVFADEYERKNRDSFDDRVTFVDSFRKQNLARAFDSQPTTPLREVTLGPIKQETPLSNVRRKAYDESPTPTPARRESLLPRPRGRPGTVKADPIEEAKRLATNANAREKRASEKSQRIRKLISS
jgi:hypothetical protein